MLKCIKCGRATSFLYAKTCLNCREESKSPRKNYHYSSVKHPKYQPIQKNDGINAGKSYAEYLKESKWSYAQSFKRYSHPSHRI